jgi:hypothetical protein
MNTSREVDCDIVHMRKARCIFDSWFSYRSFAHVFCGYILSKLKDHAPVGCVFGNL